MRSLYTAHYPTQILLFLPGRGPVKIKIKKIDFDLVFFCAVKRVFEADNLGRVFFKHPYPRLKIRSVKKTDQVFRLISSVISFFNLHQKIHN